MQKVSDREEKEIGIGNLNVSLDGVGTVTFSTIGRKGTEEIFYETSFDHKDKTVSMLSKKINFRNCS